MKIEFSQFAAENVFSDADFDRRGGELSFQRRKSEKKDDDEVLRVDTQLVDVPVVVTDKSRQAFTQPQTV